MKKHKHKFEKISSCAITQCIVSGCDLSWVNESLVDKVKKMKNNKYMTKEEWEHKNIYIIETDDWYSLADIDKLISN
jgi:hypothetical protein